MNSISDAYNFNLNQTYIQLASSYNGNSFVRYLDTVQE